MDVPEPTNSVISLDGDDINTLRVAIGHDAETLGVDLTKKHDQIVAAFKELETEAGEITKRLEQEEIDAVDELTKAAKV